MLEKVRKKKSWNRLVEFIKGYGADIFTQRFLNMSNLRAILHQGVDAWLERLPDHAPEVEQWQLFQDLGGRLNRREAIEHLTVVLEAIVENYDEYRDYNSTTTQSDRGEMLYSLLDFLRLRVSYDRVVWNLRPVIISHEILVQRGQNEAAQLWRRALNERISEEADRYQDRLAKLQEKYAMRLATVADQIGERFLGTMIVDRMRALVEPTMSQADPPAARRAFELLEEETTLLLRDPTGAGLDLPAWLVALDEQVDRVRQADPAATQSSRLDLICPPCALSLQEVQQQLDEW